MVKWGTFWGLNVSRCVKILLKSVWLSHIETGFYNYYTILTFLPVVTLWCNKNLWKRNYFDFRPTFINFLFSAAYPHTSLQPAFVFRNTLSSRLKYSKRAVSHPNAAIIAITFLLGGIVCYFLESDISRLKFTNVLLRSNG